MSRATALFRQLIPHLQCLEHNSVRCISSSASCSQMAESIDPALGSPLDEEELPPNRYRIEVLDAEPREKAGKNPNKHCRRAGRVPGILFSLPGESSRLVSFDKKRVDRLIGVHGETGLASRIFFMKLKEEEGQEEDMYPVIAKSIHRTATTQEIENISFMFAPPSRVIRVEVPVKVVGEDVSPGIKKGGFVNLIRRTISCLCMGDKVPTHFEVDVSKLDLGDRIGLETIDYLPPEITIKEKHTLDPICRIAGKAARE